MNKLIVYINNTDGFVNINADQIEVEDPFLKAFSGGNLVGLFDLSTVMTAYLSEKNPVCGNRQDSR